MGKQEEEVSRKLQRGRNGVKTGWKGEEREQESRKQTYQKVQRRELFCVSQIGESENVLRVRHLQGGKSI